MQGNTLPGEPDIVRKVKAVFFKHEPRTVDGLVLRDVFLPAEPAFRKLAEFTLVSDEFPWLEFGSFMLVEIQEADRSVSMGPPR